MNELDQFKKNAGLTEESDSKLTPDDLQFIAKVLKGWLVMTSKTNSGTTPVSLRVKQLLNDKF